MPSRLTPKQHQQIKDLLAEGKTINQICNAVGCSDYTVKRYRSNGLGADIPSVKPEVETSNIEKSILTSLKKGPKSLDDIANDVDLSPKKAQAFIDGMVSRGAMIIRTVDGRYDRGSSVILEPGKSEARGSLSDDWTHVFGITSDNHLCNRHSRLDVLNAAYDHFEREGITIAYNAGNWIDGEARFNKTELLTAPGMDSQLDYLIDKWPVRKGVVTQYIAGDDHEGWYSQREGIEVGRYLQMRSEDQGRHDLKYLGYGECDVALKIGEKSAVARIVHPGGGSAYAISYTDQKRVESYQGGEKPQLEVAGHYHKFNYGYPREVHTLQPGCTCDQSLFMRKKRLQAMVGYCVLKIKQDSTDGHITRCNVEWFPFYDRGYYEKRY